MNNPRRTIDLQQVRALIRVNLIIDWRGTSNPFTGSSRGKGKIPGLALIMFMNLVMSIFLGTIFILVSDLFAGMVLAATGGMIIVAIQVLLEFGNIIISPDDYHVIAPHPVNSRTFYFAKLGHFLMYVSLLTATVSIAPAIFAAFTSRSLLAASAVLIHFWITCVFAAVGVMNLYTLILKKIDRRRLERLLGYIHILLMIGFYLGLNVFSRVLNNVLIGLDVRSLPWTKALPSYWFAGWLKLAVDGWDWQTFALGLLGLALLFCLGKMAVSYLSLTYAESLTRTAWTRSSETRRELPPIVKNVWYRMTSFEERALLMLVRANFKHDTQFRLGVLGFIPIVILYMVYGFIIAGSNVRDPLAPLPETQTMTNFLLGFAVMILPCIMLSLMYVSKSWPASWIFYTAPFDRVKMIRAADRIVFWILVLPNGLLMAAVFTYLYGNVLHAVLHTMFMVLLAVTGFTFLNIFSIRLPFAAENRPGNMMGEMMKPMILTAISLGSLIAVISAIGYGGYIGWAIFMFAFLIFNWMLGRGRIRRIRRVSATWEFMG